MASCIQVKKIKLPAEHSPGFCVSWDDVSSQIGHCGHGVAVVILPVVVPIVVVASSVVVAAVVDTIVVAEISGELEVF